MFRALEPNFNFFMKDEFKNFGFWNFKLFYIFRRFQII